jgi:diguanylate cyclase (GGDEF)-like protein
MGHSTRGCNERSIGLINLINGHCSGLVGQRDPPAQYPLSGTLPTADACRVHKFAAMADLAIAISILALTLSTLRTGRRPPHIRSWLFFAAASVTLVVHSGIDAVAPVAFVDASGLFELLTLAFLAIGFVFLYGADREQLRRVEDQAERDPMTGLYNMRAFRTMARRRIANPSGPEPRCALGIFDLDDFKAVNDTRGHQVGDQVLRLVGMGIRTNMRADDLAARYGGDEFVLLLGGCDGAEAERIVRRVSETIQSLTAGVGGVSISAGIAVFPDCAGDLDNLIRSADGALLQVKRDGKKSVLVAFAPAPGGSPTPA